MTSPARITVRMYHVGFGDAFLVTVSKGRKRWRMLIDCGVHSQGQARPIAQSVTTIIDDLTDGDTEKPSVDVVVATHHHADHIVGFADDAWDKVAVGEVWLPWVENPDDEAAVTLRRNLIAAANQVAGIADHRLEHPPSGSPPESPSLQTAAMLAANARGNDDATARLLGGSDGFVDPRDVRFLPQPDDDTTVLETSIPGVRVHALGPSRDEKMLRRMNPPKAAEWLLGLDGTIDIADDRPLFEPVYATSEARLLELSDRYQDLMSQSSKRANLEHLTDELVLMSASKLERWCNNTSLFLVLEVGDLRLVFPGDAQEGAWEHVLAHPDRRRLVKEADLYKISHHGSHNGTPRRFVDEVFGKKKTTLLPYSRVERWTQIPKPSLLEALADNGHTILRADEPPADSPSVHVDPDNRWTEVLL